MARIIMSALQVAGYLIATQTGLAYAQTIDPTQNTQGAVLGNFMSLLGTTLIFVTNLHHLAIGAIAGSYRMLPPGGTLPVGDMAQLVIFNSHHRPFALGFQLACAVSGVRFRGLCRTGCAGAADAAIADFLCRRAAQHHVRLSDHAGADRFADDGIFDLLRQFDGAVSMTQRTR